MKERLLIIIPAYNEAVNIANVVREIRDKCPGTDYIVVNDGSTDDTRKVCVSEGLEMLDLPANVGLAGAIRTGLKYANAYHYDYAVQIDGDGQHDPTYIPQMLVAMKETDADIIIGSRFKSEKKPLTMRMFGSRIITLAIMITCRGKHIADVTSGMRLFNKRTIKRFCNSTNYRPEPDTLAYLINHGVKVEEIQVTMRERQGGSSYFNVPGTIMYMLHVLINIFIFQWIRKD